MRRALTIIVLSLISVIAFGQGVFKLEGTAILEDGTVMYRTNMSVIHLNPISFSEVDYSLGAFVRNSTIEYFILLSLNDKISVAENNCLKVKLGDNSTLDIPVKRSYSWDKDAEEGKILGTSSMCLRIPYIVTDEQIQSISENGIIKMRIEGYPTNIEFKTDAKKIMQSTIKFRTRLGELLSQSKEDDF